MYLKKETSLLLRQGMIRKDRLSARKLLLWGSESGLKGLISEQAQPLENIKEL